MPMNFTDPDIAAVRYEFVGKLWRGLLVIALLSLPMTALRIAYGTWLPLYAYHLAIALVMAAVALANHRLPYAWRSGLLFGLLWLVGLPAVFNFGLAASGIWWMVLSCLVATTLFSPRVGIVSSLLTGAVLVVAAVGFVSGTLQPAIPPERYAVLPSSWLATIVVTGLVSVLLLQAFGGYARAFERLLLRIKEQRDEIERLSLHDPLTGLPLGSLATDRIQMALRMARRSGRRVAVLYVDLDGFKQVNDQLGHDAGDAVLRACALRMRDCLREEDTVARLGGDEFLAVVGGLADAALAGKVAAKLVHAASEPVLHEGRRISVGASVGIAIFPDDGTQPEILRRNADRAMYAAKAKGRGRYEYATPPAAAGSPAPVPVDG